MAGVALGADSVTGPTPAWAAAEPGLSASDVAAARRLFATGAYTRLDEVLPLLLAAAHRVNIHGGSFLERGPERLFNTSVVFGRDGRELARYRKLHLFDVVTPDGRVLHALSVIYVLRDAPGVGRFRVVQRALDDVVVLVVPDGRTRPDGAGLASRVERVLGRGVRVAVEEVAHIPVTGSGKFRHVVSEVAEANVGGLPERAR